MITLGIRAEPTKATFVIYDADSHKIKNIEKIIIPGVLDKPEQLKYARNVILDILREYMVDRAGVRATEGNSQNQDADRLYLEAIFMESFASSSVSDFFVGRKTSICSRLKISTGEYDNIVSGKDSLDIEGWPDNKIKATREAILVAIAASV